VFLSKVLLSNAIVLIIIIFQQLLFARRDEKRKHESIHNYCTMPLLNKSHSYSPDSMDLVDKL